MDSRYGDAARVELSAEAARSASLKQMLWTEFGGWTRGDLGVSRQYEVPVARTDCASSRGHRGFAAAGDRACMDAVYLRGPGVECAANIHSTIWQLPSTLLLAVPTAAMATICMLSDRGGPVLVMTLLVAARDFKFLDRMLRKAWHDPHLLQARAQGLTTLRLVYAHILPGVAPQLLALATLSMVTALSALVPVEVIFSVPGLGQLAWSAAMNRDLPVLLAVTMIMAVAVTFAGMFADREGEWQGA
jgi:peptide/nickel transport system permease protein